MLTSNIAISLVVGKTVGIFVASYMVIKFKLADLPKNVNYVQMLGISVLGGLGFTMSLFISNLAYTNQSIIDSSKLGILIGSLFAGSLGYFILKFSTKQSKN
jgi:NhaA family Na+:H+ antiporter